MLILSCQGQLLTSFLQSKFSSLLSIYWSTLVLLLGSTYLVLHKGRLFRLLVRSYQQRMNSSSSMQDTT
ncbi:hypothetical protein BJX66DRAFT_307281 [Aspergillus keveii]|uniref:Uncharacterized protein n=1 Tax=Aspergillus keveii TaxID=714993 RepID=A0ABR4G152_9EURO